ncbi:MAG TPA: hypothetical protein VFL14_08230 [Xanthomonadales bacterium]|nr:hypothetical protein [Xanthomonadales bacterium]
MTTLALGAVRSSNPVDASSGAAAIARRRHIARALEARRRPFVALHDDNRMAVAPRIACRPCCSTRRHGRTDPSRIRRPFAGSALVRSGSHTRHASSCAQNKKPLETRVSRGFLETRGGLRRRPPDVGEAYVADAQARGVAQRPKSPALVSASWLGRLAYMSRLEFLVARAAFATSKGAHYTPSRTRVKRRTKEFRRTVQAP